MSSAASSKKLIDARTKLEIALFTATRTVINSGYRMVYPLLPIFAAGLGVELAEMALAFSIRSFLGILTPFLSTLADSLGRKKLMLTGAWFFFVGCATTALMGNFLGFVIGISLLGIGNGVFIPSIQSYLSDKVPFERRGMVLSITELSWSLSFIIGVPLLGALMEALDWRAPFAALSVIGVAILAALWILIPNEASQPVHAGTVLRNLGSTLKFTPVLAGLGVGLLFSGANEVVNLVFGVWIKDTFSLEFATMAIASAVIGSSELVSELLSAAILDKIGKRRAVAIALLVNSAATLLLPLTAISLPLALAGLALFYVSFEFALISLSTTMSEVLPASRATVMALIISTFSVGRMLGSLFGGALYGISFWAVCGVTVIMNVMALLLIPRIKLAVRSSDA